MGLLVNLYLEKHFAGLVPNIYHASLQARQTQSISLASRITVLMFAVTDNLEALLFFPL